MNPSTDSLVQMGGLPGGAQELPSKNDAAPLSAALTSAPTWDLETELCPQPGSQFMGGPGSELPRRHPLPPPLPPGRAGYVYVYV